MDISNYKKSNTFSTEMNTVKNDFNVDSFFEDTKQFMNISIKANKIKSMKDIESLYMMLTSIQSQKNICSYDESSSRNIMEDINIYEDLYDKVITYYNSKDLEVSNYITSN